MKRHAAEEGGEPIELDGAALVEDILAEAPVATEPRAPAEPQAPTRIDGVVIGVLVGLGEGGAAMVDYPGNPSPDPLAARSVVTLGDAEIAREVALLFESGDPMRPMVMGVVQQLAPRDVELSPLQAALGSPVEVKRDGERVVIEAEQEITLRCGDASITLTRAGKVLIRGAYVLARASGVNRIQGGSVQIN